MKGIFSEICNHSIEAARALFQILECIQPDHIELLNKDSVKSAFDLIVDTEDNDLFNLASDTLEYLRTGSAYDESRSVYELLELEKFYKKVKERCENNPEIRKSKRTEHNRYLFNEKDRED